MFFWVGFCKKIIARLEWMRRRMEEWTGDERGMDGLAGGRGASEEMA